MKDAGIFLGLEKNNRDFFGLRKKGLRHFWGVAKRGLRDFLGYAKKSSKFFGLANSEVVIFLDMKYEPLSDPHRPPPPLVIKICEWAPGSHPLCEHSY